MEPTISMNVRILPFGRFQSEQILTIGPQEEKKEEHVEHNFNLPASETSPSEPSMITGPPIVVFR